METEEAQFFINHTHSETDSESSGALQISHDQPIKEDEQYTDNGQKDYIDSEESDEEKPEQLSAVDSQDKADSTQINETETQQNKTLRSIEEQHIAQDEQEQHVKEENPEEINQIAENNRRTELEILNNLQSKSSSLPLPDADTSNMPPLLLDNEK